MTKQEDKYKARENLYVQKLVIWETSLDELMLLQPNPRKHKSNFKTISENAQNSRNKQKSMKGK